MDFYSSNLLMDSKMDRTRNGVNAAQKRSILHCSHHLWRDPKPSRQAKAV